MSSRKRGSKSKSSISAQKAAPQMRSGVSSLVFWSLSIASIAVTLALVPGPVQDRILAVIGRGETKVEDYALKTKIKTDQEKREAVVRAFKHAYFAYERDAFPSDNYHPISRAGSNLTAQGSIGYTLIDSLTTMQLMSLSPNGAALGPSYKKARRWLKEVHTFDVDGTYSTFELTIRLLGGLLSAHWAEYEVGITPGLFGTQSPEEVVIPKGAQKVSMSASASFSRSETEEEEISSDASSSYDPGDLLFLSKAVDLASRLSAGFNTRSGLPLSGINLKKREGVKSDIEGGLVSTAEVGTIGLEFRYLSYLLVQHLQQLSAHQRNNLNVPEFLLDEDGEVMTEEEARKYWDLADGVSRVLREGTRGRLASAFLNPEDGEFIISPIKLGSRGDSYFEYLLKQYLQTGKSEPDFLRMWDSALDEIHSTLFLRTPKKELLYVAELMPEMEESGEISWRRVPRQDHLACFLAGQMMLSAAHTKGVNNRNIPPASVPPKINEFPPGSRAERDWKAGEAMLKGCWDMQTTISGLAPETIHFRTSNDPTYVADKAAGEWYIKGAPLGEDAPIDARYILRPEIVESLFYAYRLTADPKYRRYGWKIFEAIEKHCRLPTGGYAGIRNVDEVPVVRIDEMESFFLVDAPLLNDSVLPIEEIVFNTEAHPLPKIGLEWETAFM